MLLFSMNSYVLLALQASMRNSLLQQFAVRLFEGQLHNVGEHVQRLSKVNHTTALLTFLQAGGLGLSLSAASKRVAVACMPCFEHQRLITTLQQEREPEGA
jgi:hypothetical protein